MQLGEGSSCFKEGGHLYSANHETVIAFLGAGGSIAIPGNATHINGYTYQGKAITGVTFESNTTLTSVGQFAFAGCA